MLTNTIKTRINRAAGAIFTALAVTTIGLPSAQAESWELRTAAQEVKGTRALEEGQLDKAIRIMDANYGTTPYAEKGAMLTNLCLAYILKRDLNTATSYCDRAVKHGFSDREAYNNRGVLRSMQGDYPGAVSDFERAGCFANCPEELNSQGNERMDVARRNLQRVQVQYAQQQEEQELQVVESSGN